jgi:hypothetical protein
VVAASTAAHPDHLRDVVGELCVVLAHGRGELARRGFVGDVRAADVEHEPIDSLVAPDVEAVALEHLDDRGDELGGQRALLEDRHRGVDHEATVEPADRRREGERLDQHRHAAWRSSARDGEVDPCIAQLGHRGDRGCGEHLVRRDERAVDVGDHQPDG